MSLTEMAGPKAQIFVRGLPDPYWFGSVRDISPSLFLPEMPKAITAIYVSDMARAKNWDQPEPGTWVDAHKASYVIGSRRRSGMGTDEAIPFGDAAAARRFADANGGRVVSFDRHAARLCPHRKVGKSVMLVTRRRFIAISAAAGGLPLLPLAPARAAPLLRVWSGTALGCDATLQIHHPDPATADRLIEASLAEVRRLEAIMSLYRPDSALSRLNRDGVARGSAVRPRARSLRELAATAR